MIKINLKELNNIAFNQKIFIRIECEPYILESKKINGWKSNDIRKTID